MTIQGWDYQRGGGAPPNGFILLEVLVAMSLIMGAWMVSAHTYPMLIRSWL